MSADNCWKIFQNKLNQLPDVIDDNYRARLESDFNRLQQDLARQNRQMEDINPDSGKTYLDEFLETINTEPNKKLLDDIKSELVGFKNIDEFQRQLKDTYDNLMVIYKGDKKFGNKKRLYEEAFISQIYNTNFTYNTNPLELLIRNQSQVLAANFQRQALDILGETNDRALFDGWFGDKTNQKNFMREYNNIINNPSAKVLNNVSGDRIARDLAKAFVDNVVISAEVKMKKFTKKVEALTRNRIKVRFRKEKLPKNADEFVEDLAPRLDEKIHGDIDLRKQLARDIYNQIQEGANWREIDNLVKNYNKTDQTRGKPLTYKSGDDMFEMSQKYSPDQNPLTMMLNTITENGRLLALTEKFGANYQDIIKKIQTNAGREIPGRKTDGFKSAINFLQESIQPEIKEQFGTTARVLTSLRSVQAGARLGSAVITSLMDLPVVAWAGRNIFKLPAGELISAIFRVPVYRSLNKTNVRNYQLMTHDFAQAWMANSGERFGLIDMGGPMSKFERGTANWTQFIFKVSGLNWWTESLQKSVGTVYQKYLGRMIKEGTAWDTLDIQFRGQMEKFGVGKTQWEKLLKTQNIIDSDGGLNLYAIKDDLSTAKGLQSKMISVIRDAVDTMVIKPSEFDKAAGRFFKADDGSMASQFVKLVTQFKTHPITYTRKVLWRRIARKQAVRDNNGQLIDALDKINNIWPLVTLAGSMLTMGVVVAQLKEVTAGKSPLTDPGELLYRSIQQSGVAGLISDFYMTVAEPMIKQLSSDKKVRTKTSSEIAREYLGPVLGDAAKILSNISGVKAGAVRFAKDMDDGEFIKKEMTKFTKHMLGYFGLQSLWQTKALYRALITEYMTEILDYKTYVRQQKQLKRDAREQRYGGQVNIIDLFK